MKLLKIIVLLISLSLNQLIAAEKVVIEFTEGICGDCCVMKAMSPKGVLNLENVKVGDPKVTFVYDEHRTTPEKILEDLKTHGKQGKIITIEPFTNAENTSPETSNWVQPVRVEQ